MSWGVLMLRTPWLTMVAPVDMIFPVSVSVPLPALVKTLLPAPLTMSEASVSTPEP